ncbi:MAG: 30S ribosomal protein S14 [Pseudobdellovibrionaceae bacterium]|nr:30S ribosomal protein S14 [Bdellovibrionales bacterium]USN47322.1 MAG: 30S ribosomal protein S14 [Pseudobdellovibrionaceae bacterium]
MAKLSAVNKNNRRKEKADKYWQYRRELKDKIVNEKLSDEDRMDAQMKLQKLPRDTSPFRVVSRCRITGRPKGVLKKFGLSRIALRDMALDGKLPGVTKSSW